MHCFVTQKKGSIIVSRESSSFGSKCKFSFRSESFDCHFRIKRMLSLVAITCLIASVLSLNTRPNRPNVVIYLIDDLGWTDVGYRNGSGMHSPTLDSLASSGILLDRYYTQPVCSPSRSALMTGRYPFQTGMQHFTTLLPGTTAAIPKSTPTLAELFQKAGYATGMLGKWHLGYARKENTPNERGFDRFKGYLQGMTDYWTKYVTIPLGKVNVTGLDWWADHQIVTDETGIHNVDLYKQGFDDFLDQHISLTPEKPFFTYYSQQLMHIPLESKPEWVRNCGNITNAERRTYCGMVHGMDDALNELVNSLKTRGMWDDTLLIVSTDNGGMVQFEDHFPASAGSNWPLRAGKSTAFEGGVRSIGFVNGGDNVIPQSARGTTSNVLSHIVDWLPTLGPIAGFDVPSGVSGFDLWDALMNGEDISRESIPLNLNHNVLGFLEQSAVLAKDGWKLVLQDVNATIYDGWYYPSNNGVKKIEAPSSPTPGKFLFNLNEDPNEYNNLFNERPDKVKELKDMLSQWDKEYTKPQNNVPHLLGLPKLHQGIWAPFLPNKESAVQ